MKKQNDFFQLKDILPEFLEKNKLQKGIDRISAKEAWENVMGKGVMSYTADVTLSGETLVVQLTSATLREELSYGKEIIISRLNDALGRDLIKRLRLT